MHRSSYSYAITSDFGWAMHCVNDHSALQRKEGLHSIRPPVEIEVGIIAISEPCRDWHDALMLVIGKRDEDMHGSRRRLWCSQERA